MDPRSSLAFLHYHPHNQIWNLPAVDQPVREVTMTQSIFIYSQQNQQTYSHMHCKEKDCNTQPTHAAHKRGKKRKIRTDVTAKPSERQLDCGSVGEHFHFHFFRQHFHIVKWLPDLLLLPPQVPRRLSTLGPIGLFEESVTFAPPCCHLTEPN